MAKYSSEVLTIFEYFRYNNKTYFANAEPINKKLVPLQIFLTERQLVQYLNFVVNVTKVKISPTLYFNSIYFQSKANFKQYQYYIGNTSNE